MKNVILLNGLLAKSVIFYLAYLTMYALQMENIGLHSIYGKIDHIVYIHQSMFPTQESM